MNNKKKNILLGILIVGVISMTIAFASLATNLNISGTANVASTSWNIHFQEWQKVAISTGLNGNTNTAVSPEVSGLTMSDTSNVTKVEGIAVTLNQPGDIAKYNFEIKNDGNITAKLDNFSASLSPSSDVIGYQVKCYESNTRTGTEVTTNSTLAPAGIAYCFIEIKYNDATNGAQTAGSNQVYTQSAVNTSLSASWTWVQDGVSANNNQSGGSGNNSGNEEPIGNYTYSITGDNFNDQFNSNWKVYYRNNGQENEVCGVYSNGATCLTNSTSGRASDFTSIIEGTYTSANIASSGLQGYSLTKAQEMLSKGASTCTVLVGDGISVWCEDQYVSCNISSYGDVDCIDLTTMKDLYIYDGGSLSAG